MFVVSKLLIELIEQLLWSEHTALGRNEVGSAILWNIHLISLALQHSCLIGHQVLGIVNMDSNELLIRHLLDILDAEMGDVLPLDGCATKWQQDVEVLRVRIVLR